ncbi:hypothetical protein F5Y03DRAFT_231867 [Xylaria venustula]|nr:hypothetical protein F5Y03DRAFT_231867 [Xylaria venustula]
MTNTLQKEVQPSPPPPLLPPLPPALPDSLPKPPIPPATRPWHSASSQTSKRAQMAAQFGLADGPREPHPPIFTSDTFKPCHMFFYGTLMDADTVQRVTGCPTKPGMCRGYITGFKAKMWGDLFPALIPQDSFSTPSITEEEVEEEKETLSRKDAHAEDDPSDRIRGMVWKVDEYRHFWALQQYETSAYRGHHCSIHVEDVDIDRNSSKEHHILNDGVVFVWAKNPRSPDLTDNVFDLAKWQRTLKSTLFTSNPR